MEVGTFIDSKYMFGIHATQGILTMVKISMWGADPKSLRVFLGDTEITKILTPILDCVDNTGEKRYTYSTQIPIGTESRLTLKPTTQNIFISHRTFDCELSEEDMEQSIIHVPINGVTANHDEVDTSNNFVVRLKDGVPMWVLPAFQ